jgi:hypothetical protein
MTRHIASANSFLDSRFRGNDNGKGGNDRRKRSRFKGTNFKALQLKPLLVDMAIRLFAVILIIVLMIFFRFPEMVGFDDFGHDLIPLPF